MARWFEAIQPILAILDEGLSLYRRNFLGFVLITMSWCVPTIIAIGLLLVGISWAESVWPLLLGVLALLAVFPLSIYLVGGLSRAAAAAADGRPVRLREALAIHPLRAAGMGCFTLVYWVLAQVATSFMSILCVCPLYIAGFALAGLLAGGAGAAGVAPAGILIFAVLLGGLYGSLMLSGASGSGLFYGLQPWVQEGLPFGASVQRSIELIVFRFPRNLLAWLLSALLLAAAGISVMATVGALLPLPLFYALGDESPLAQALASGAWLLGLMLVLPPLPIWMALLYRRNRAQFEGADLAEKVREWEIKESEVRIQQPPLLNPDF